MPSKSALIAVVAFLGVPIAAFAQTVDLELSPKVMTKYGDAIFERIRKSPELIRYVDSATAATVEQRMRDLSLKASEVASGLPDEVIMRRHSAMLYVIEQADAVSCAQIYRGGKNPAIVQNTLNAALLGNSSAANDWFQFIYDAHIAALRGVKPREVSQDEFDAALDAMSREMDDRDGRRFREGLRKLETVSNAEACWLGRTHYRNAPRMKAAKIRSILIRGLLP